MSFVVQDKLYDLVDTNVKRALTSLYNTSSHAIKMAPPIFSVKKGASLRRALNNTEEGEGGDEGTAPIREQQVAEESPGEEEDDAAYLDRLFLAKKKKKSKSRVLHLP